MKIVPNRLFIILGVFFLQQTNVFANGGPPPPSTPPPPPGLPLDGGLIVLIVLGIFYGFYKWKNLLNIKKASN